ncbi:subtype B tannase [Iodobacter ciconiae]|uniref:Alpha/beta hydrolase n=1 Tax=Iodobacter ciconiae TaxID=2496266 RepID=A0A3S8ZNK6_9NEIS|nr:subtype B tannase [Iodobacter ciconiae]AZN35118.1 alpha/beta hydrolase [Iodobacter ciconiae]
MKTRLNLLLLSFLFAAPAFAESKNLHFNASQGQERHIDVNGQKVQYLAFEGLSYVAKPLEPAYQQLNVYIPKAYFEHQSIGRYTTETAPIFLPNNVGGYMPSQPKAPGLGRDQQPDAIAQALAHGLVVVSPGTRGRTLQDKSGNYTGKAPAAIVDLKAVVRYLKFNDIKMPGDANKIISNGTSAGGALSALLGASGDAPDYLPYLKQLGAAPGSDAIYAVSSYCPITNLGHADLAYEWMFQSIHEATAPKLQAGQAFEAPGLEPGSPLALNEKIKGDRRNRPAGAPVFNLGPMTAKQLKVSSELASAFPDYLNSLSLTHKGQALQLSKDGTGAFQQYLQQQLLQSAMVAQQQGKDLNAATWLKTSSAGLQVDWNNYIKATGRLKKAPAFDSLDLSSGENSLFGDSKTNNKHFTDWGVAHSASPQKKSKQRAPAAIVTLMDPMHFIGKETIKTSTHWRIRHGAADNDTSLAVPAILALRLENSGKNVDFSLPFAQPHGGDYDLAELFNWIATLP